MIEGITGGRLPQSRDGQSVGAPSDAPEAAREFERILVRQLVRSMTDSLFKESLGGEGSPQWLEGYADAQREVLNDALARHLIDSGTLRLSDLMMRQWGAGQIDDKPDISQTTKGRR